MKHTLEIKIKQEDRKVTTKILFDNVPFEDFASFSDKKYAVGMLMDIFDVVTGNRYKTASDFRNPKQMKNEHL